ncbi:hypothetical protein DINM_003378 [Dirofilaria immitis]|nr:hypothetical protein [Dirofilaria immitis]
MQIQQYLQNCYLRFDEKGRQIRDLGRQQYEISLIPVPTFTHSSIHYPFIIDSSNHPIIEPHSVIDLTISSDTYSMECLVIIERWNVDEEKEERYGASFIVIDGKEGIVIRLVITAARVGIELRKQNLVIYRSVDKMESINQSISSDVLHFILFCAGRMEAIEMALLAVKLLSDN